MAAAALLCYDKGGPTDAWRKAGNEALAKRIVEQCAESGHGSVIEHAGFTFGIEGISRACSHQLVRHRIGAFCQQSQRYVNLAEECWEGGNFVVPPSFEEAGVDPEILRDATKYYSVLVDRLELVGFKGESANQDARYILPNACKTNLIWTTNFRNLIHVCSLRLCKRAQWEIRDLFYLIVSTLSGEGASDDHRWMAGFLKPKCRMLGYCDEGERSCGAMPRKAAVLAAYDKAAAKGG
jgi:thymidylate synthase (FAD)